MLVLTQHFPLAPDTPMLEGLLSRPVRIVWASLILLTLLAWYQLFGSAGDAAQILSDAAVPLAHAHHFHASSGAWGWHEFLMAFLMWLLMSIAMMLPTAAPAILSFADLARAGRTELPAAVRVGVFVLGYLLAWWAFGLVATVAQWGLASATAQIPAVNSARPLLYGGLLTAAGLYQFSTLKDLCLSQCRSPMMFFLAHWRDGLQGASYLGLRHGVHCVGCCWALMALMLLAGTMNLACTAALTFIMLLEKLAPGGKVLARVVGFALILCGGGLMAFTLFRGDPS